MERVEDADRGAQVLLQDGTDSAKAMRRIMETVPAARIELTRELTRPRLEDIFIRIRRGRGVRRRRGPAARRPPGSGSGGSDRMTRILHVAVRAPEAQGTPA